MIWDAHCHLSDARIFPLRAEVLREMKASGFSGLCLGGYDPEEWARQRQLKAEWEPQGLEVRTSVGLHPWWLSEAAPEEIETAWGQLAQQLPEADALGETGLDFQARFSKEMRSRQEAYFERALILRSETQKQSQCKIPLVLHVVRAHDVALRILKGDGRGCGLVHSFSGDWSSARRYLDLGFLISISGAFLRDGGARLRETVQKIPLDALVLESDAPDQRPRGFESRSIPGWNDPTSILGLAKAVADVRGERAQKVLEVASQNVIKLFPRGRNGIQPPTS